MMPATPKFTAPMTDAAVPAAFPWRFVFMTACGFTFPCVQVLALDRHGKAAGTAASVIGDSTATTPQPAMTIAIVVAVIPAPSDRAPTSGVMMPATPKFTAPMTLWFVVRPRTVERLAP
jgi:DHA1 family bicyclomycin/chloramphenicol resistance-like MFS transporter